MLYSGVMVFDDLFICWPSYFVGPLIFALHLANF